MEVVYRNVRIFRILFAFGAVTGTGYDNKCDPWGLESGRMHKTTGFAIAPATDAVDPSMRAEQLCTIP